MKLSTTANVMSWILQLIAAGILLQTLFFKFTGADESKYIFCTLGVEPWGRIASGVVELIAAVLLLVPRTVVIGALGAHLSKLGIVVKDDRGLLFGLALAVFVACLIVLVTRYQQIPLIGPHLRLRAM